MPVPPAHRPTVSVIVPFVGTDAALAATWAALGRLALHDGDEVIVADNRAGAIDRPGSAGPSSRVVGAEGRAAAGFARNAGARAAGGDWLVFLDADVMPVADLLNRYFEPAPGLHVAVLAGAIVDCPGSAGWVAAQSASRGQMSQQVTLVRTGRHPYAQSGNCAIRRTAFEAVGGFDEQARYGEDADLCFRLARAGWGLEERPDAAVEHPTAQSPSALMRQLARHGSGAAWLERRYPGEFPAPDRRELVRRIGHYGVLAGGALRHRRPREAAVALLELASLCAFDLGRLRSNDP